MTITLVAIAPGYHDGRLIRIGERFTIGASSRPPEWALPPEEAAAHLAAKNQRLPLVELVAIEHGFYGGRMVAPGTAFLFDPNPLFGTTTPRARPSWAASAAEAHAALDAKRRLAQRVDTKPIAAQQSVREKASQAPLHIAPKTRSNRKA